MAESTFVTLLSFDAPKSECRIGALVYGNIDVASECNIRLFYVWNERVPMNIIRPVLHIKYPNSVASWNGYISVVRDGALCTYSYDGEDIIPAMVMINVIPYMKLNNRMAVGTYLSKQKSAVPRNTLGISDIGTAFLCGEAGMSMLTSWIDSDRWRQFMRREIIPLPAHSMNPSGITVSGLRAYNDIFFGVVGVPILGLSFANFDCASIRSPDEEKNRLRRELDDLRREYDVVSGKYAHLLSYLTEVAHGLNPSLPANLKIKCEQ